jgi:hypothetical protein
MDNLIIKISGSDENGAEPKPDNSVLEASSDTDTPDYQEPD